MPNHCTNNLTCTSGKLIGEIIKPYLTKGQHGYQIDFNKIVPMPEGIVKSVAYSTIENITKEQTEEEREAEKAAYKLLQEENTKTYGYPDWYEWSVNNWGTKWNAYNHWQFEDVEDVVLEEIDQIGFQTAWSPPLPVIKELSRLTGESLRLTYYDEGWMFGGEYLVEPTGEEEDNCYDDIDDCPEELWEDLDVENFLALREEEEED